MRSLLDSNYKLHNSGSKLKNIQEKNYNTAKWAFKERKTVPISFVVTVKGLAVLLNVVCGDMNKFFLHCIWSQLAKLDEKPLCQKSEETPSNCLMSTCSSPFLPSPDQANMLHLTRRSLLQLSYHKAALVVPFRNFHFNTLQ